MYQSLYNPNLTTQSVLFYFCLQVAMTGTKFQCDAEIEQLETQKRTYVATAWRPGTLRYADTVTWRNADSF